ncbi:hypothetical protein FB451DRAFT_1028462 [Mycena latifolia]|nr:hypothetical protein FB451DRAFT_1028462 [Mycena latifolia]
MQASDKPFSSGLPPELEREIFETTALLYPKTIPKLLRVARRVLLWKVDMLDSVHVYAAYRPYRIEPLLYNIIRICPFDTTSRADSGVQMLRRVDMKPAEFFANAVRHMDLIAFEPKFFGVRSKDVWGEADLERVLGSCTGIRSLMIIRDLTHLPLLPMFAMMRPT